METDGLLTIDGGFHLHWQLFFPKALQTRSSVTCWKSGTLPASLSIDSVANRSCDILERRHYLMNFSLENLLFSDATVIGAVRIILRAISFL
jgi:hypothetical protein